VKQSGSRVAGFAVSAVLLAGTALIVWKNRERLWPQPIPLAPSYLYEVDRRDTRSACVTRAGFAERGAFDTGLASIRALAVGPDGLVAATGESMLVVLETNGTPLKAWAVPAETRGLVWTERGIWAAVGDHVAQWTVDGRLLQQTEAFASNAVVTSLAVTSDRLYVADAAARLVYVCDPTGGVQRAIGRRNGTNGAAGFLVPSPYFDLVLAPDGLLRVVDPGRHRIEAYTADGDFELFWGKPSTAVDGFCGCCNPAHLAVLPDGRFVTSEKGLRRVKVYDAKGVFAGVILGTDVLGEGPDPVAVAVDAAGRVLVAMPESGKVRVYESI